MRSQAELLIGTNIPTDALPDWQPTNDEAELLAVAEGFAFGEWARATDTIDLDPGVESIPENYEKAVHEAGRWTKDYISRHQLYE